MHGVENETETCSTTQSKGTYTVAANC